MSSHLLLGTALLFFYVQVHAQHNNTDSLERRYRQALSQVSSPKLEEKKNLLRSFQRRGYASTLTEVLYADGFTAMASYLRSRLQIEYSISHELVMVDVSALAGRPPDSLSILPRKRSTIILPTRGNEPIWFGFDIDWTFPGDPWKRE